MLPVTCAPEPPAFDQGVRQRGLSAIDELVGRPPRVTRPGRRRRKIADREAGIPADDFPPFWRNALNDLLTAYEWRCAFLAVYLEPATGHATVDHMVPKSRDWRLVYEWSNYRLCAGIINAKKSDTVGIVDPFDCGDGWFELELVGFQIVTGPNAPWDRAGQISATIELLNLPEACHLRRMYVTDYEHGHIDLTYLERRAPFVAAELRRQNRLHPGDE